jgi:hypothetical protein
MEDWRSKVYDGKFYGGSFVSWLNGTKYQE